MSFTFSHPALVLPLTGLPKRWRSSTGLVIGSMVPDFEKFLNMSEHDPHSHTWWGIFYFNLPLALLLSFLFHLVVRNPLVRNLPAFLRLRFNKYTGFDWVVYFREHYVIITLSILLGTLSHLVLDVLTHSPGHRKELLPFMELGTGELTKPIRQQMSGVWSQLTVSVAGKLVIGWFILQLPKQKELPQRDKGTSWYWIVVGVVVIFIVGIRSQIGEGIKPNPYHPSIVVLSAVLISLVVSPVLLSIRHHYKQ
ncbi:DUF4184 family protein [Rufibacter tibetensis]|uniref:DUF4184 family protein n=1 Tax=Rufibacter tibetensis TaxID=512763 RepID=A0A0P0CYG8_9BACT|nr:DUF4184 family protein [Rufibacter tibetensis]ALI99734.1 hypothetical protein DC20_13085 [Rufibacter tibetensis]